MSTIIKFTVYHVTLESNVLRQVKLLMISVKGAGQSQKAEHLSPFSVGLFLVTVNLDLSEWSAIS